MSGHDKREGERDLDRLTRALEAAGEEDVELHKNELRQSGVDVDRVLSASMQLVHTHRRASEAPSRTPRRPVRRIPRLTAMFSVSFAAAATLLVVFLLREPNVRSGDELAALAQVAPVEVDFLRSGEPVTEADREFRRGLDRYARGEFAEAESLFVRAAALSPRHAESRLHLGSARLLQARASDAVAPLELAVRLAVANGSSELAAECRWHLAQAYLLTGDRERTRQTLTTLAEGPAPRARLARELLAHIDSP